MTTKRRLDFRGAAKPCAVFALICFLLVAASCSTPPFYRVVYVPWGKAVRLRETLKKVKIWVKTEDGKTVPGEIDIPEGWFALPDPREVGR